VNLIIRHLIAVLAALTLVVTAPALALSRTGGGAAGVIVICTGTGPLSVAVGADGLPVESPHVCPDCALAALAAVLSVMAGATALLAPELALEAPAYCFAESARDVPYACARAPPSWIVRII
jgi:hypothetical protein